MWKGSAEAEGKQELRVARLFRKKSDLEDLLGENTDSSIGKESACNAGDPGSIPGSGRSPGEGTGYPLQCPGPENSRDCIAHGVADSRTPLSAFHFHCSSHHVSRRWVSSTDLLLFPGFFSTPVTSLFSSASAVLPVIHRFLSVSGLKLGKAEDPGVVITTHLGCPWGQNSFLRPFQRMAGLGLGVHMWFK